MNKLSHSKLSCILSCPMTYYLTYKMGIYPKVEKAALSIGSAVHWGIEHNTEDLQQYYIDKGTFKQGQEYTRDQLLAEAMVHGYLKHKDEIFDDILIDDKTGEKLELIDETHELYLTGKLKSYSHKDPYDFVGIIDLLLLTNRGFIIIDYKTSSFVPDWNNYLEQIYRYIFILRTAFPDVPVYKIGIINIRKTGIRQKKGENEYSFLNRMREEYEINDEQYVNWHMYDPSDLDDRIVNAYLDNLSKMADTADLIDTNNMWFINYSAANGQYGKSQFWDIFYHTPDAYVLYGITDKIFNEEEQKVVDWRDCVPIDMLVIDHKNVLNKYEQFKVQALAYYSINPDMTEDTLFEHLKSNFITDDYLLKLYWKTLLIDITEETQRQSDNSSNN